VYGKSEEEWAERARAYLEVEIKRAEIDYDELVRRLKEHEFKSETRASITNKLARVTFAATLLLAPGRPRESGPKLGVCLR
jgi:hypothetical protein